MPIALFLFQLTVLGPAAPDPRALLDRAVAALGGPERLARLDRWLVEGRGRENLTAELQGRAPVGPTYRPHQEIVAVVRSLGRVAWERKTPRNDHSLRWRRFIHGADSSGVVDWNAGFGVLRPRPTSLASRAALMRRIPHLLLAELAAGPIAVESRPRRGGLEVIGVTLPDSVRLTLTFDRAHRLAAVEYPVAMPGAGHLTVRWSWPQWRADTELRWVPTGHRLEVGGVLYQEVRYSRYRAETDSAAALVHLPADPARFVAAPTTHAVFPSVAPAGSPAPGVHLLDIRGFRALLIEFADFVALVEAPEQHPGLEAIPAEGAGNYGQVTLELRRRLAELAPDKPLRYLVVTQHHDDHLSGLGGIAGPGTTVLVAPGHRRAATRALAAPPIPLGPSQDRPAVIETVAARRVIADSARRIEVFNVGDNPHTTQSLMVWLPAERIVFQGDLFYFEPDGPFPPSGRETMNRFFARWLARQGIEPAAIYGVHNAGAAGPDAIRHAAEVPPTPR
jgi:glyoxylase-like metal-dependent hydrolase (beta-lactamase superfamily II)